MSMNMEARGVMGVSMSMSTDQREPLYVCAGICRVDPGTSRCIGCGRPVDLPVRLSEPAVRTHSPGVSGGSERTR